MTQRTDLQPYFLRAIHEWAVDNDFTPYIEVDAEKDYVEVPREYVQDGKITLNISPKAVKDLHIGKDMITFQARFGGIIRLVKVPLFMVMRIYAYENGVGMAFREEREVPDNYPLAANRRGKPHLKLIVTEDKK